jgi:hypothetical protein
VVEETFAQNHRRHMGRDNSSISAQTGLLTGDYLEKTSNPDFGTLYKKDGSSAASHFRNMTNKILHLSSFDWDFSKSDNPILVCHPTDKDRWQRAEISIVNLGALCGLLMS